MAKMIMPDEVAPKGELPLEGGMAKALERFIGILLENYAGALPMWPYSSSWGYFPSGALALASIGIPGVMSALVGDIRAETATLDGELVVEGDNGVSQYRLGAI